jgi:hypothetical protein
VTEQSANGVTDGPESELSNRATVTAPIAAPAGAIFVIVANPARHPELDGSGMLKAAPDARPLTAIGQTFDIEMDRRPLGGTANTRQLQSLVREVPDYMVRCTVTQLISSRLIEWNVAVVGKHPGGHVWGWRIEPLSDGACLVSHYCDWTNISDELRAKFRWPVVPADWLRRLLENLDRMVTWSQHSSLRARTCDESGNLQHRGAHAANPEIRGEGR